MKRSIYTLYITAAFLSASFGASAQNAADGAAAVDVRVERDGGEVRVAMGIDLANLAVGGDETVIITPVIEGDGRSSELPPVEVMGRRAYMYYLRNGANASGKAEAAVERVDRRGVQQRIDYSAVAAYEPWMKGARLVLRHESRGCSPDIVAMGGRDVGRILYAPYSPTYVMAFAEPEPEPVKVRDESMSAYVNFKFDRSEIVEDYRDNARELAEVRRSVMRVKDDADLTITSVTIDGWASPEGTEEYNLRLSQCRADALADYMCETTGIGRAMITATGRGEDWAGLRKAVEDTPCLLDRDKVLAVIDGEGSLDEKDERLSELIPPTIYERLVGEMYPRLRRNDYRIVYNVRSFDVEEARALVDTDPRKLSVAEMYLVAESYGKGTPLYGHVMSVAAETYPASASAAANAAALLVEAGDFAGALKMLERTDRGDARVLNVAGVAYARSGDAERAREAFRKAAEGGSAEALHNLAELEKSLE